MKKVSTFIRPRPASAAEISAHKKRLDRNRVICMILCVPLLGLMIYSYLGGSESADVNANLMLAGFVLAVLIAVLYVFVILGMIGASSAALNSEKLAWLDVASQRVPEVAQFVAELQAQDRPMLVDEYVGLHSRYQARVSESLLRPACAVQ